MAAEPKGIGKRAIDPDYESHILRSDVKRLCAELKESRAELKEAHAELSDGHMVRYDLEEAQNDLVRVRKQLKDEQDIGRKADLAFFARLQADRLQRDAEAKAARTGDPERRLMSAATTITASSITPATARSFSRPNANESSMDSSTCARRLA